MNKNSDYASELSFAARLDELPRLAAAVEELGEAAGLAEADVFKINLALDELLTNVVGYAFADREPGSAPPFIHLGMSFAERRFTAVLSDDGLPFNPLTEAPPPATDGPFEARPIGGLGIHFIRTLMDEATYRRVEGRNQVTLVKRYAAVSSSLDGEKEVDYT